MSSPGWVDAGQYPFESHFLELPAGRMHYVDEGQGVPVLMVHGTPTWSFLYRHLIRGLSDRYRCIAPDNLGFGLSEKPAGWSYLPADHAANLQRLIETLGLRNITLVVHDFGGPIGLAYAVTQPANVKRIVLFNTWMWSLTDNPRFAQASKLLGSPLGRFLYRRFNFSVRVMMPLATGQRNRFPQEAYRHYLRALQTPEARQGTWILARELAGSGDWYESLWRRAEALKAKPVLVLWGMKDSAFRAGELERWRSLFTEAEIITFPETGHFVQEEKGEELVPLIRSFLEQTDHEVPARMPRIGDQQP